MFRSVLKWAKALFIFSELQNIYTYTCPIKEQALAAALGHTGFQLPCYCCTCFTWQAVGIWLEVQRCCCQKCVWYSLLLRKRKEVVIHRQDICVHFQQGSPAVLTQLWAFREFFSSVWLWQLLQLQLRWCMLLLLGMVVATASKGRKENTIPVLKMLPPLCSPCHQLHWHHTCFFLPLRVLFVVCYSWLCDDIKFKTHSSMLPTWVKQDSWSSFG